MTAEKLSSASPTSPRNVTCICWNNEGNNIAVGLQHGFIIYSTEFLVNNSWLREIYQRSIVGGIGTIALHAQSNVIITSGWASGYRSIVTIRDLSINDPEDEGQSVLAEVKMPAVVNAIRFHPRLIAVGLENGKVHLFNHTLQGVESFKTAKQAKGGIGSSVMAMATTILEKSASGMCLSLLQMVILGPTTGTVRCVRYVCEQSAETGLMESSFGGIVKTNSRAPITTIVEVHHHAVRCVSITPDGARAITVSERGTALKLLDVYDGVVLCQFSRGTTPNVVHSLALLVTATNTTCACVSDTGTLHLFHVPLDGEFKSLTSVGAEQDTPPNGYGVVRAWADYYKSVSPIARFTLPDDTAYGGTCESSAFCKPVCSLSLKAVAKKDQLMANLVQWDASPEGGANARLLCIEVVLKSSNAATINVARTFCFPKNEL